MAIPRPLILTDPSIKISDRRHRRGLTELACSASHVELTPDTRSPPFDTMCGSVDYPGRHQVDAGATLYQSFDVDATEEVLSAAVAAGLPSPFELIGYKTPPVSATNPKWTGFVSPQPYAPINGDAGDASEVEIEWSVTTGPIKRITPVLLAGWRPSPR